MADCLIDGHCDEKFASVRDAFTKNFEDGLELGASYAVSVEGKMVVDLWGGHASVDRARAWEKDTLVQVSSSSKIPISLCGLMLVDRGLIDLDEPVARYWPEFAQNGKETLPVRYLFSHTSGLAGLDDMPGFEVLCDWDEVITRLAAQKPWWEPGTQSGYQGIVYGHLIGELVARTTGKSLETFFKEEVADPHGIDFTFGSSRIAKSRIAELDEVFDHSADRNDVSDYHRAMGYLLVEPEHVEYTRAHGGLTALNIPAGNGAANARSLAQVGSLLATGSTTDGKRFISEATARLPYQEQSYTVDRVLGDPVRYGVGFGLASKEIPLPFPNAFHWGGSGGSAAVMVPEHRASWAYTPNKFSSHGSGVDVRAGRVGAEVIKTLLKG